MSSAVVEARVWQEKGSSLHALVFFWGNLLVVKQTDAKPEKIHYIVLT